MKNNNDLEMMSESTSETETIVRFGEHDEDTIYEYSSDGNTDLEELTMSVARRMSVSQIIARKSLAWARGSLEKLPIRLTLGNMGFVTIVLAVVMPRAFTYILVYPIFRLVFGTLYPAYASYKAVRTKNVKEYVKWMMYWIVFALFTCAETFTDVFFSFWFPFYYEIKIILVLWLLSPATKGSSILYRRFVHPALSRREAEIDDALARATEQGYTAVLHLGTRGVNYATTVLMQTAIKGGGGLVQQLKKSYSLSDLTGEKEDENRNTPSMHDETDMEVEPRRREHPGRRGYSPRRTQSSSNRVEMYFSEVDVDVRQPRPRDPIASLNNIRSTDDISSGYSSGEALQSNRVTSPSESLLRTSSVGARTRARPRSSTTKKVPEEEEDDDDYVPELPSTERIPFPSPISLLSAQQALELMLLLSQIDPRVASNIRNDDTNQGANSEPGSSASQQFHSQTVDPGINDSSRKIDGISNENKEREKESIEVPLINEASGTCVPEASVTLDNEKIDIDKITDEICQDKLDQLKVLLSDAHKAVTNIVSSHEKLHSTNEIDPKATKSEDDSIDRQDRCIDSETSSLDSSLQIWTTPNVSRSNSENDCRAGKYHKKPAPKAPLSKSQEELEDEASQSALKATLVIKTGTLKTFTNVNQTKNVFVSHLPESSKSRKKKSRRKEGFSKLLTIPKTFFNHAFHKDQKDAKDQDSNSSVSETSTSRSRSVSFGSARDANIDDSETTKLPDSCEGDSFIIPLIEDKRDETNIELPSRSSDCSTLNENITVLDKIPERIAMDSTVEEVQKIQEESVEDNTETKDNLKVKEMSHSPTRRSFQDDNKLCNSAPQQKAYKEESAMKLNGC